MASDGGAVRTLLDADADAEVHWLGDDAPARPPRAAAAPVVLIDLEDGGVGDDGWDGEPVNEGAVRAWVDAVGSGGHLVLAVGPRGSWRLGLDAVVASGRRWRLTATERHGAVVHLWLQLEPPEGPSTDDAAALLGVMAEAAGELGRELTHAERRSTAPERSANVPGDGTDGAPSALSLATIVPERDREIDGLRSALERARADLERTRVELRKARAALDRIHGSVPGRLWRRYRGLVRRVRDRRPRSGD